MSEEVFTQPLTAAAILAKYRPSTEPIVITLPDGESMTFKPVCSTDERESLINRANAFLTKLPARGTAAFNALDNADVIPKDDKKTALSLLLHFRAIDPPLDQRTAFEYHRAPELMDFIEKTLALADKEMQALRSRRIREEMRGKSRATTDSGQDSPPANGTTPEGSPTS